MNVGENVYKTYLPEEMIMNNGDDGIEHFTSSVLIKELVRRGDFPLLSNNESVKGILEGSPKIFSLLTRMSHDETELIKWCEPLWDVLPSEFLEKIERLL
jgi:hypothetical protein